MDNPLITLGIDAGNGAFKLYGAAGGLELVSQVATAGGHVLMVSPKRNRVTATIDAGGPIGFNHTIAVGASGVWLADPFDEQALRMLMRAHVAGGRPAKGNRSIADKDK